MTNYIDVVYDEKVRPYTGYPLELCKYLFNRFDMKEGNKLLDVGCGRGDFLKGFKDISLEVYGLDIEKSNTKILEGLEVRYSNLEKELFPFENQTFDVVFSKSVIEHLFNPDNFIKECHRVLKPGGRIIIMTPDWSSLMKIFFDDYTHRQPYTVTAIKDFLDIYGFKEVSSELFYQLPIVWKFPIIKIFSCILRQFIPVTTKSKIKFIRWSLELMVLGTGIK